MELNACHEISPTVERTIVSQLQHLFHQNNNLVLLFKTAIELMPTDTHQIVISTTMPYNIESFFWMESTAITLMLN